MTVDRVAAATTLILACVAGYPNLSAAAQAAPCGDAIQCCLANGGVPSECEKAHPEAVAAAFAAEAKKRAAKREPAPDVQEDVPAGDTEQAKCRPGAPDGDAKDCEP